MNTGTVRGGGVVREDESTPKTFDVTIGTGSEQEDPMGQAVRTLQAMWNPVGTLFGSNDLF